MHHLTTEFAQDQCRAIRTFQREDGTQVKVTMKAFEDVTAINKWHFDTYAHQRQPDAQDWTLLNDRPHPDWRSMSVQEYNERGRSELLQALGHGRILALGNDLMAHYGIVLNKPSTH